MRAGVLAIGLLAAVTAVESAIIRVKPTGSDGNSGLDWNHAKATVSAAIETATVGDEVWVAAGTYNERIRNKVSGELSVDVALYGGFAGTETSRGERNVAANATILDGGAAGSVVTIDGLAGPGMRIDGFRIRNGDAMSGGGISITASAPTIANNDILGNMADMGGGIEVWGFRTIPPVAHARIESNVIQANRGGSGGGGIAIVGASCEVVNNVITRNTTGGEGGGIGVWVADSAKTARPRIADNFIFENASNLTTPGMTVGGGGVYATERDINGEPVDFGICTPRVEDNVIAANAAVACGGGIAIVNAETESAPVTNNTIIGNSGSGVCWGNAGPTLVNNLVAYNTWGLAQDVGNPYTATIRSNDVYGNTVHGETTNYFQFTDQTGLNGNIAADPKLVRYGAHRMRLEPSSPCVGAGDDSVIGAGRLDIDLQARTQGAHVDIGADESDGTSWTDVPSVIRVKPGGSDASDGSSWAAAKATIGNAITAASTGGGGEVWVMQGTYAEHLELAAWVDVYGGFAGTETTRAARDPASHLSVVDGGGTPPVVNCGLSGYRVGGIDGFKITGGGTYTGGTSIPPPSSPAGWGGGVKCTLSSPVIRGNTIVRNSLGDPNTAPFDPGEGAGIALVGSHALVISNTISENEVLNRSSVGGGVYLEWSAGDLWYNTISTNRAPEGSGVYAMTSRPMLFNNLISQNENYYLPPAYFGSLTGAVNLILCWDLDVLFNYFVSNVGSTGGAIYLDQPYRGSVANNLFVGNYAYDRQSGTGGEGGALWLLIQSAPPEPVHIVSNTFAGNHATSFYAGEQGGAIAVLPASSSAVIANNVMAFNTSGIYQRTGFSTNPVLVRNDMYNGTANYVGLPAGATDILTDPRFVDRANGNYRLQSSSPAIDAGNPAHVETAIDIDGAPRIQDGNGDSVAVVDLGAYELSPDSDSDGVVDWQDCAPQNSNVWSAAVEVAGFALQGAATTSLSWTAQNPGTVYDVVTGSLLALRASGSFAGASCRSSDGTGTAWSDTTPNPAAGEGRYYVVRGHNVCGNGGWGVGASGARTIGACP